MNISLVLHLQCCFWKINHITMLSASFSSTSYVRTRVVLVEILWLLHWKRVWQPFSISSLLFLFLPFPDSNSCSFAQFLRIWKLAHATRQRLSVSICPSSAASLARNRGDLEVRVGVAVRPLDSSCSICCLFQTRIVIQACLLNDCQGNFYTSIQA